MPFTITSPEDESLFRAYTEYRDNLRNVMGRGVYPNLIKAVRTFEDFEAAQAGPLADEDLVAYHTSLMAPIASYVAQIYGTIDGLVSLIEGVEAAVPGVFGLDIQPPGA